MVDYKPIALLSSWNRSKLCPCCCLLLSSHLIPLLSSSVVLLAHRGFGITCVGGGGGCNISSRNRHQSNYQTYLSSCSTGMYVVFLTFCILMETLLNASLMCKWNSMDVVCLVAMLYRCATCIFPSSCSHLCQCFCI
jgi:hypothetical protein